MFLDQVSECFLVKYIVMLFFKNMLKVLMNVFVVGGIVQFCMDLDDQENVEVYVVFLKLQVFSIYNVIFVISQI